MTVRGLLKTPEINNKDQILKALQYMQKCIDAHIEVVYTYTKAFYDDFFMIMDRILAKFYFDIRVMESDLKSREEIDSY